jgi:hypothetical protein
MWRFFGWLGGFVAAALISAVAAIGIRWAAYFWHKARGR